MLHNTQHKKKRHIAIQSVSRALRILMLFSPERTAWGVMEVARTLRLHKSTASRLMGTLEGEGFLESDPLTGKYRLGLQVVMLANSAARSGDLRTLVKPAMEELSRATQETINLTLIQGRECVNIEQIPSPHRIKNIGWIGRRTPLHCTSTGKAMLAFLSPDERAKLLPRRLERHTSQTITRRDRLIKELKEIRRRGYAVAQEELEEGLTAVAAPIVDQAGKVMAALAVSGPSFRLPPERLLDAASRVVKAATRISRRLGYAGDLPE
ncbi:MAG: IclR family transcriptional regulator [Candidatus Rokubacteria bacterium]|nr:IclR family transcriptional regulator [Candidatus Rokubacteria bacterium]